MMPELRQDPVTGRRVIIAPDRADRPMECQQVVGRSDHPFNPFAEGNEFATPPEILAYRDPGTLPNAPGWRVRVVPNKFPALTADGNSTTIVNGLYESMNAVGAHEVIIEGPHGETNMSRLPVEIIREVLLAYRERLKDLKQDQRLAHALVFKNKGAMAGASLEHGHSQLIATGIVPVTVQEEIGGALMYYNKREHCIYEEIIRQELSDGSRVVIDSPAFLVFCPYASRFPFETCILPKHDGSHFESIHQTQLDELGTVLKETLAKLELALDNPPYNYLLHTAPFREPELKHYRWHFEIFPRITGVAGYEWGSGFFINTVAPEEAAARLREVL